MKRRSFLQAVGGAIAAVFVPVVAAKTKLVGRLDALKKGRVITWLDEPEFWEYHPPETVAELRAAIESRYETVHEFKESPYEEQPLGYGIGRAPTAQPVGYDGPFYRWFLIAGDGASEKEAVADAFSNIKWDVIGGKEMMWRVAPRLNGHHDFASNRSWVDVRARVLVIR